jgi:DNA polymerase elongation subunit (family B)
MDPIECKLLDFVVSDQHEFVIQMFGLDEARNTYSITVRDYQPFVYLKVSNTWSAQTFQEFMDHFYKHNDSAVRGAARSSIVRWEIVSRKKLYGFDGGSQHKFICIYCSNMRFIYALKHLYYDKETEKVVDYTYMKTRTSLYELQVPPLLRFFHIQEISPSGWIRLEKYQSVPGNVKRRRPDGERYKVVQDKVTHCMYELECSFTDVISLADKDTPVPYKICSFDIEASSSHGDFPEAIKDYNKVAYDIVNVLDRCLRDEVPMMLEDLLLNVFDVKSTLQIDRCFPKVRISEDLVLEGLQQMLSVPVQNHVEDSVDKLQKYFQKQTWFEEDNEDDTNNHAVLLEDEDVLTGQTRCHRDVHPYVLKNAASDEEVSTSKTSDLLSVLTNTTMPTADKVAYLMASLQETYPPLEGDQVTFIGSTFVSYGQETPSMQHCICVNRTDRLMPDHTIECYATEKEALLAWTALIQREDPDIIIGYNIFGFDYKFMYERAEELEIVDEFTNLGRNLAHKTELEVSSTIFATGAYEISRLPMEGRLQIDMLIYMRKEFNFTSYKLDYISGQMLGDAVQRYVNETENTCRIWTKNMKGLEAGAWVHFEVITFSTEMYKEGVKFNVLALETDGFVIEGQLDCTDKMRWGLAKDDVSPQQIFEMTRQGPEERGIIAKYCIQDCNLVHHLFQKVDILTNFTEMSKLCSVPINFLVMRGQGIKLTSYVAKMCRKMGVLMPWISKGSPYDAYEGAIVLEPKCDLYLKKPVACVDYSSLYPSSIISENLSHDSKVWTKEFDLQGNIKTTKYGTPLVFGVKDKDGTFVYDNLPGYQYVDVLYDTYGYRRKENGTMEKVKVGTKLCRFAQYPDGKKAILPSILLELLAARKAAKKLMEKESDPFKKNIYDKRQLSIKVTANSLYGQCGAKTSTFYEMDVAASTTATGRKLLLYGKSVIEQVYGDATVDTAYGPMQTKAEYVYGDTDSVFFTFNLTQNGEELEPQRALEVTIALAQEAGALATKFLKPPHDLEYEKTFLPFCLLSKKRYVGMLYEFDPTKGKRKEMGIVLKRRDNAPIVKDVYGGIIDILMKQKDVALSMEFLRNLLTQMVEERVPMEKLIITKQLRSIYKKPMQIAHNVLAQRIGVRNPGNKPSPGDRIAFVYIHAPDKKLQGDKIETPTYIREHNLKVDYGFYISNQIMKPVVQVYALVLEQIPEFSRQVRGFKNKLATLRQQCYTEEEYNRKMMDLKTKEVEKLLFQSFLRDEKNKKTGQTSLTKFFSKR